MLARDRPRAGRGAVALFALAVVLNLLVLFWPVPPGGGLFPHADKAAHLLVFGAVAWTGRRALLPLLPLVVVLGVHAFGSELTQHLLLPARGGEVADSVADLLGVAVGSMLPLAGRTARLGL